MEFLMFKRKFRHIAFNFFALKAKHKHEKSYTDELKTQ